MGVNIPAAARALGMSPDNMRKLVNKGTITPLEDGSIDIETARAEWLANSHPGQGKDKDAAAAASGMGSANGVNGNYRQVRVAREFLDVKIRELEFKRLTGELIPVEQVKRDAFSCARQARDRLIQIEARVAPLLAPISDIQEIRRIIHAEIQAVCDELGEVPPETLQ
jgi:hypothetical protein